MPVIIDAGILDASGNTARIDIVNSPNYTGLKQDRVKHKSAAGTMVNTAYYRDDGSSMIQEFMAAAVEVFGDKVLLQFEDFNSNDAFPLLDTYRSQFVSYNDDIQGTAAVTVAGILGALKIKNPEAEDLISLLPREKVLLHGAGSANLGAAQLLTSQGGMPKNHVHMTNSRGLIWASEDGSQGTFRNEEQKQFAVIGEPDGPHKALIDVVRHVQPSCLVGAVGVAPNCFTKEVMELMMEINAEGGELDDKHRPVVFALSNPKTQAEITSENAYTWTNGQVIYGSGTKMPSVTIGARSHNPGQVNNVFIFPGMSFGAVQCQASSITDKLFIVAAEAVANSLDEADIAADRVMPPVSRIRDVSLNVACAVVWACQQEGLARKQVGETKEAVKEALKAAMWTPDLEMSSPVHARVRGTSTVGLQLEDPCLVGNHVGTWSGPAETRASL